MTHCVDAFYVVCRFVGRMISLMGWVDARWNCKNAANEPIYKLKKAASLHLFDLKRPEWRQRVILFLLITMRMLSARKKTPMTGVWMYIFLRNHSHFTGARENGSTNIREFYAWRWSECKLRAGDDNGRQCIGRTSSAMGSATQRSTRISQFI